MNRFHVHLNVADLPASIAFYTELFAASPTVEKADYAKWMLEDPRINFAISAKGRPAGVDHLGLQTDSASGLAALGERLEAAGGAVVPETATVCCYAQSDKAWTEDPQGVRWETFHTTGESTTYSDAAAPCATDGAGCTPDPAPMKPVVDTGKPCCAPKAACC
jgi:predicted enzyme related to lactoylglutathione lyase